MPDLLPWNATPQERALSEAVGRVSSVDTPLRELWNPDTCPPPLLAWLAWAFSVDEWNADWTDTQKREFIKRSVEVHRYKGTIGAVRDALAALQFSARVQEWFNQSPAGAAYTFRVLLEVDQVGIDQAAFAALFAVIDRTKNLRSHLDLVELSVRTEAGPHVVVAAGVGNEITLTNYERAILVLNETTICF